MRDDEDHIRQFMPVLRRIIILVAVLTAIPVVMWTITAFVRTYVGPPKTPTFQHMADAAPAGSLADAPAATPSDNGATGSTPTSPQPIVEAKAAAMDADANAPASDANAEAAPVSAAANVAAPNAAPPDPAFPNVTAPNAPPAPAGMAQTGVATNNAAPANAAAAGTTPAPAPGATGPADLAASGPPAYAAPSEAPSGGVQVAAQQPAPTNWPTAQPPAVESLPPGLPIAGIVPLPRKRPRTFELAQGAIPLPMPRPEAAGTAAPPPPATPFDWVQHLFHAASDASTPPAAADSNGYTDTPH
jgi:hypothetical protein